MVHLLTAGEFNLRITALQPQLRGYAVQRLRDEHDADDAVQNTLIEGFRNLAKLRDAGKFRAWLFAILRFQIRTVLRGRRDRRWQRLADQIEAARPAERRELFEEFDMVCRRLAAAKVGTFNICPLALYFCFDWAPREIAGVTGGNLNTIYSQLRSARAAMRRMRQFPPLPWETDLFLKMRIVLDLWDALRFPVTGAGMHNLDLLEPIDGFLRLSALQYPDKEALLIGQINVSFQKARLLDRGDLKTWLTQEEYVLWNRDTWDREELRKASACVETLLRLYPASPAAPYALGLQAIYLPRRHADVDWPAVIAHFQEALRRIPHSRMATSLARAISIVNGPLAAARYLEQCRDWPLLRDYPMLHCLLGKLYYMAGKWEASRKEFRRFLRYERNTYWRETLRAILRDCDARIPSKKRSARRKSRSQ